MTIKHLISSLFILLPTTAVAIGLGNEQLRLSGFATMSISESDNDTLYYPNRQFKDSPCYDCDTILGLQLDYQPNQHIKLSTQVVKRPEDRSRLTLEWLYGNWQLNESLSFRVGRLRIPTYLMSEYYYVGNAFPWVRPPSEVYNRQLGVTSYNGIELRYLWQPTDLTSITLRPFFSPHNEATVDLKRQYWDIDFNNLIGAVIEFESENFTLRYHHSQTTGTLEIEQTASGSRLQLPKFHYRNDTVGMLYSLDRIDIWAEYQRERGYDSFYIAAIWHIGTINPYLNYAEGRDTSLHQKASRSLMLGVRYDLPYNLSLNLEAVRSESLITPHGLMTPPRGQFVYSNWSLTNADNTNSLWTETSSSTVDLITLAINWNF